jgi:hypothetical protein
MVVIYWQFWSHDLSPLCLAILYTYIDRPPPSQIKMYTIDMYNRFKLVVVFELSLNNLFIMIVINLTVVKALHIIFFGLSPGLP